MNAPALSKSAILLRDTYQIYARMLAAENITVIFDEAISAPANFDILNRVLRIAPAHSAQQHLVPGLVIHEVGHALFSHLTEKEAKKIKRISRLLNIIDDGYQERQMCKKHPNTKKHLRAVFDEFFIKDQNPAYYAGTNKLSNIVNTLNFNCKGFKHGLFKKYPDYVEADDLKLLQEAELINEHSMMDRWVFSKKLSKALKKYGKIEEQNQDLFNKPEKSKDKKPEPEEAEQPTLDDEDEDGPDEDDSGDDSGEGGGGEGSGEPEDSDEEPEEGSKKVKTNQASSGDPDEDAMEELLDEIAEKLNDHHQKIKSKMNGYESFELPTGKELIELFGIEDLYQKGCITETILDDVKNLPTAEFYKLCVKEAKKVANKIFTQFNMRVQASNLANTQFKNSGMLDPERAALYQVYDDVFMKNAIEPNRPNHAYSISLDWSGSMNGSVFPLMLRIMELTYFARSAGVEVEVMLYTTSYQKVQTAKAQRNVAGVGSKFIRILNTKQHSQMEIEQRLKAFWLLAHQLNSRTITDTKFTSYMSNYGTSGTNILEGLMLGHYMLSCMEAEKKTCFLLTDGDDSHYFDFKYSLKNGMKGGGYRTSEEETKIYVNGFDVDSLYKGQSTRHNATMAVADMYKGIGQKTVGVAWNCGGATMQTYCSNVIKGSSNEHITNQYIHSDNLFINAVVKELL